MHDLRTRSEPVGTGQPSNVVNDSVITSADISRFLSRRRRAIVFPIVGALLGAYAYMQLAVPIYTARAQIIIDPRLPQFLPGRSEESVLAWDTAQVESEIAVIQSERIAGMVVGKLALDKANDFRVRPSGLSDFVGLITGSRPAANPKTDRFREALELIQSGLSVRRTGLSYAIDVAFSFPDPLRAKEVANATASAYILDQLENRAEAARLGGEWLQNRMIFLRSQMNAASQAAQAFRANHDYRISRTMPSDAGSSADASAESSAVRASPEAKTLDELEAAASTYRRIYESFLESYTQSVQRQSFPVSDAHILTEASLPLVKNSPKGTLIYALAGLVGCLFGFGSAIALHNFDRTARSAAQVTERVGVDGLGTLPRLRNAPLLSLWGNVRRIFRRSKLSASGRADPNGPRMIAGRSWKPHRRAHYFTAIFDPRNLSFSRGMMTLKVFVDLANRNKRAGCIGVTAASRGEGTSTLASNLGVLCAELGSKTLVIDADIGLRSLSRQFKLKFGAGLGEVLSGTSGLTDAIVNFDGTSLDFLPSTALALPSQAHLLASKEMAALLRQAAELYDIVILDLPPVLPVGEVLTLSVLLDGVILVIEAGKSSTDLVATLFDCFNRAQARMLGFVLTKAAE